MTPAGSVCDVEPAAITNAGADDQVTSDNLFRVSRSLPLAAIFKIKPATDISVVPGRRVVLYDAIRSRSMRSAVR